MGDLGKTYVKQLHISQIANRLNYKYWIADNCKTITWSEELHFCLLQECKVECIAGLMKTSLWTMFQQDMPLSSGV